MGTQTDIPAWLTDGDMAYLTNIFDDFLNSRTLWSLLLGIYTGIIAVTMWNIAIRKSRRSGQVMVVVIILLYITSFAGFAMNWSLTSSYTLHGQNIWIRYLISGRDNNILESVGLGVTGIICNILADSAMIWRCWMVWGQHYLIIVLPTLCLVASIVLVFKIMDIHLVFIYATTPDVHNLLVYALLSLATTLWCTLAIIYRILSVGRVNGGPGGGLRTYRHVIEVLVESSTFYCVCLIVYIVCYAINSRGQNYIDVITTISRGISPTLLVGRVAAGHARPDDSWEGSIVSSLHFGQDRDQTDTQDSSMFSINLDDDPEAQVEQTDEPDSEHVQTRFQRVYSDDVEAQQEEVEIDRKANPAVPSP